MNETAEQVSLQRKNIHSFSSEEKKQLFRNEWQKSGNFQKQYGGDKAEFDCGNHTEKLRNEITRLLIEKEIIAKSLPLEELHNHISAEMKAYNYNDGVNKISTFFYDTDEKFRAVYLSFLKNCLQDQVIKKPFWFQDTPTIRIHCPKGENSNHYPRFHSDIGYGHPPEEVNLWMPLTTPKGEQKHGFRLMNLENSRKTLEEFDYDFAPFIDKAINDKPFNYRLNDLAPEVATEKGKFLLFDSRCIHTGEPLLEHTRVSIDIRIVTLEDYDKMDIEYQGTGRRRVLFTPGNCYSAISSDKI